MTIQIGDHILYNNNQLIAVNKPAGAATQPDGSADKSMQELVEIYCKHPVQIIHRLDRPASGVLLFAKNKRAVAHLHKQFADRKVKKVYWAVVEQKPDPTSGELKDDLIFNKNVNKAFTSDDDEKSKSAELSYQLVAESDRYFLLEVALKTGRQHQIRAQLSGINCPIKGDVKYGARRSNKDRSIHLHARQLEFQHPINGKIEHLEAPAPQEVLWQYFEKAEKAG